MTELTKEILDDGARLEGAANGDFFFNLDDDEPDCRLIIWLVDNAKALIAGCRDNARLRAEVERLRSKVFSCRNCNDVYLVDGLCHACIQSEAEGQGEDDE